MATADHWRGHLQHEQRLRQHLRILADRLDTADRERVVAIGAAHRHGLSVRQIAAAVRLSPARVHQLLHTPDAATSVLALDVWEDGFTAASNESDAPLAATAVLLRECADWLERLDRGERVVVNLREPGENATENVAVDRPQVRQVLRRLARDLEDIGGAGGVRMDGSLLSRPERLADLAPTRPRLSPREEREQLRRQLGLDP